MAKPDLKTLEADIRQRLRNPEKWQIGHLGFRNPISEQPIIEARFVRDMKPKRTDANVFLAATKRVVNDLDPTQQGLFHVAMVNAESKKPRIIVSCRNEELLRRFLFAETAASTWQDIVGRLRVRTTTNKPLEKTDLRFFPLDAEQAINLYKATDSSAESFLCKYPSKVKQFSWANFLASTSCSTSRSA